MRPKPIRPVGTVSSPIWKARKLSRTLPKLLSMAMVLRSPLPAMGHTMLGFLNGISSQPMHIMDTIE